MQVPSHPETLILKIILLLSSPTNTGFLSPRDNPDSLSIQRRKSARRRAGEGGGRYEFPVTPCPRDARSMIQKGEEEYEKTKENELALIMSGRAFCPYLCLTGHLEQSNKGICADHLTAPRLVLPLPTPIPQITVLMWRRDPAKREERKSATREKVRNTTISVPGDYLPSGDRSPGSKLLIFHACISSFQICNDCQGGGRSCTDEKLGRKERKEK